MGGFGSLAYAYDAFGQRFASTVNGTRTTFAYDPRGRLLIAQTAGAPARDFVYLNGRLLARIDGNTVYYYHLNALGAVVAMTDSSKNIVWQAHYTPFGRALVIVNTITNHLRLPGQYEDSETGLYYNYFRDVTDRLNGATHDRLNGATLACPLGGSNGGYD